MFIGIVNIWLEGIRVSVALAVFGVGLSLCASCIRGVGETTNDEEQPVELE